MTIRNALCIAVALCVSLCGSIAHAAPLGQTLKGQAKASYEQAKLAYQDGDFNSALVKFEHAYQSSKDPRLLWNMAASYKGLRKYARVIELLDRYVSEGGELVTKADRAEAKDLRDSLAPFVGELTLRVTPADAVVRIDDEPPRGTPMLLDLGVHRVHVQKRGFRDRTEPVRIAGGEHLAMAIELVPTSGTLAVHAGSEETIFVDGKRRGTGRWRGRLPPGAHTVEVRREDATRRRRVTVADGKVSTTRFEEVDEGGVPMWVWIAGGVALGAAAMAVTTYFVVRPQPTEPTPGTLGVFELP